jgi:Bacterial Ig domain
MSLSSQRTKLYLVIPGAAILISTIFGVLLGSPAPQNLTTNPSKTISKNDKVYISLGTDKESYNTGENITLKGTVINGLSKAGVENVSVILEAFSGDKQFYKSYAITDSKGNFIHKLIPATTGDIKVTAKASGNATVPDAIITVSLSSPTDTFAIAIIIILIIAPTAGFIIIPVKYRLWSIVLAIASLSVGLVYLHGSTTLNDALKTALSTVLFAPVGTYIFDYISRRGQEESNREASVGTYRNDNLKIEVTALIKIYEEICQHESILQRSIDDITARLSTKNYVKETIVGTMANLPAMRINKYYSFVTLYNTCLDFKAGKRGAIRNVAKFNCLFNDFKKAYADLETVLYLNIIYDIGEIHQKFLSFPTIRLPMRLSSPLSWELLVSNALKGIVNINDIQFVDVDKSTNEVVFRSAPRTNLIKLTPISGYYPEYYKNEAENELQKDNLLNNNDKLNEIWKNANHVYSLFSVMKKEDIYDEGIAYKFMNHLGRVFQEKYENLEKAASKLQLLSLEAYSQVKYVFNDELKLITLQGNSNKDIDRLQFEILSKPNHGELSPLSSSNVVRYSPKPRYLGEDSFTFIVTDGIIDSEAAKVTLQVIPRLQFY